MRHPAARWLVLVLAVSVAAGLGYRAAMLEQRGLASRRALATAASDARALQGALSDAQRALAAMASPGQSAVSRSRQVDEAIVIARTHLAALTAVPGGAALSASAERLDRLAGAEGRVREYAVGGRSLMASDVAYGEALPHIDAVDGQIAEAMAQISTSAENDAAATRDQQVRALAGALGALALAALMLVPVPRPRAGETAPPAAASEVHADDLSLDLGRGLPLSAMAAVALRAVAPTFDLTPVATACAELARLSDGAALALVLARVAPVIGAKGIVVWLVDADRRALQAAASWGYDPRVVERFPAVPVTDDNPTAHAFSSGVPATAAGRASQPAAVATPIIGSNGAVGVLALELTAAAAPAAEVVAIAGIVAAQLATLLEPLPRGKMPATGEPRAQQG